MDTKTVLLIMKMSQSIAARKQRLQSHNYASAELHGEKSNVWSTGVLLKVCTHYGTCATLLTMFKYLHEHLHTFSKGFDSVYIKAITRLTHYS